MGLGIGHRNLRPERDLPAQAAHHCEAGAEFAGGGQSTRGWTSCAGSPWAPARIPHRSGATELRATSDALGLVATQRTRSDNGEEDMNKRVRW